MGVDPKHLVQLHWIVETGSFVLAAEQLALTQPALSRNIRLLEERVGVKLLQRGRHGATPTELGRLLAAKGKLLREVLEDAGNTAAAIHSGELGQLRIGLSFGLAGDYLSEPAGTLLTRLPQASLQVHVGPTPSLLDSLAQGGLDLVVAGTLFVPASSGIVFEPLIASRLAVIARAGHPLATGEPHSAESLRTHRWIMRHKADPLYADISGALTSIGVSHSDVALECASEQLALGVLQRTDLLMLAPYLSVQKLLHCGRLAEIPAPALAKDIRPIGVAHHADRLVGPTTRAFLDILKEWSADQSPVEPHGGHGPVASNL